MSFARYSKSGFTVLEMAFVLVIGMVVTTISVPMTRTALKTYHLNTAVSAVTGAVQTSRYQAIMQGYHYNITFDPTLTSYQVGAKVPPATTFSNVGTAVPWDTSGDVTITTPLTTLEFYPGGTVTASAGSSMTFTLSNGIATKTVTVSGVGNVTVQ